MSAHYDIAVIGSGAAGIAAAVSAARTGRSTLLLDKNPAPGGIGGFSGLTFGVGGRFGALSMDYAFAPMGALGMTNYISLGLSF